MSTYIVFDLDETIGYFTQFGIIWESIEYLFERKLPQEYFNCILDLYPLFLRPSILTIFRYLKHIKRQNNKLKILIYTNNQGPKSWCNYIVGYIEHKIKYKLFDQIIYAYKVNGRHIEFKRTSHNKTYGDFKRCVGCNANDKICFIDDQFHPSMKHKNIYYINIKPYYNDYDTNKLVGKFINSNCYNLLCKDYHYDKNKTTNVTKINKFINTYNYAKIKKKPGEDKLDKKLSKHLLFHIQKFLKLHLKKSKKTRKRQKNKHNKSKKNDK